MDPLFSEGALPAAPTLSVSALVTYLQCPRRYKFRYLNGGRDESSRSYLLVGRWFHATLADFFRQEDRSQRTIATLRAILDGRWRDDLFPSVAESWRQREAVEGMIEAFARECDLNARPFQLEVPFRVRIGDHTIRGRIDRVDCVADGSYEIIDYATVDDFTRPVVQFDKEIQVRVYALCASAMWPQLEFSATSYLLIDADKVTRVSHQTQRCHLQQTRSELTELIGIMHMDSEYLSRANPFCGDCTLASDCDRGKR
jgi:DNA helicase-2/ATP-dependent DNA helicase PcrA